jgi:flavin reductase (DIM6/NTAB) family NADH-FMN oxidoreductase RutF
MRQLSCDTLDDKTVYKLLTGLIVPRPIAWVGSLDRDGVRNLAPFSFFNVVSTAPPMIGFAINFRENKAAKDTLSNITQSGEFTVNIVDEANADAMHRSSFEYPPHVDEFAEVGVTSASDAIKINAPRVAESPAQLECRHHQTVQFGSHSFVVGQVVAFHVADRICNDRLNILFEELKPVGRMAGNLYCHVERFFSVPHKQV